MFEDDVENLEAPSTVKSMIYGMRDAVKANVDLIEGGVDGVKNMNVWAATFRHGEGSTKPT